MERRGKWMWYAYAACVILFPVAAPLSGRAGVVIGIVGTAFGLERLAATWNSKRRGWSVVFLVWIGMGAAAMLLPIWGHSGFEYEQGKAIATRHDHYLWEIDHVH